MGAKLTIEANTKDISPALLSKYPDQMFVKVRVNKIRLVDVHIKTCATYNFISPRLVDQLGLQLFETNKEVQSASGEGTTYQWKCNVNLAMPQNGFRMDGVECLVRQSFVSGEPMITLGHDFLRYFKHVSLMYGGDLGKVLAYPHTNISLVDIMINKVWVRQVRIYCSSNQSFMSLDFAQRMMLPICNELRDYDMEDGTNSGMFCLVNMSVGKNLHKQFRFQVVENLNCDILLGVNFAAQHAKVKIFYGGRLPRLKVKPATRKGDVPMCDKIPSTSVVAV